MIPPGPRLLSPLQTGDENATVHDQRQNATPPLLDPADDRHNRARMRLFSLSWALLAALGASLVAACLPWPAAPMLDALLRAGGCGLFYGLLAFHLQRVDPDDGHLQAGLVGAVCGIRSLATPLSLAPLTLTDGAVDAAGLADFLLEAMMEMLRGWLPLWLPLIGSALALQGALRLLPALRP
jgi:hypothetical protein